MVSWNKSMVSAFKLIGYSIIWWIIGIILIFIGLGMIGSQLMNITGIFTGKVPNLANILIGFIVMAIGFIIIISGFLASFMKVLTELIIEETGESKANKNIPNTKLNKYESELKNFEKDIELKSNYADKGYDKGVELGRYVRHVRYVILVILLILILKFSTGFVV